MKTFCIAGPVDFIRNYYIPERLDWKRLDTLVAEMHYFVLHAPRQSGKTTAIEEYVRHLNAQDLYSALYINIESAQAARDNIEKALIAILTEIKSSLQDQLAQEEATINFINGIIAQPHLVTLNTLAEVLSFWAKASLKPRVLFIDEIDSLIGDSLLSVLRQIRAGFPGRPKKFSSIYLFDWVT